MSIQENEIMKICDDNKFTLSFLRIQIDQLLMNSSLDMISVVDKETKNDRNQ